jgi:hypothetical protein
MDTVDAIRPLADDSNQWIRVRAIRTLWKITRKSALVLPLLMKNLKPEPVGLLVVDQLKQLGPEAHQAVGQLRAIADSDQRFAHDCALDEAFRQAAREALASIEEGA